VSAARNKIVMAVPKATSAGKGRNTPATTTTTTTTTTRWEGKVANDDDDDDDDDDCVVFPTTKHATGGRKNAKANDAPAADVVVVTHVELFDAIESSVTTPAPLLRLFHPPSRRNDRRRAVDDSLHDDEDDDGRLGNGNDDDKEEEVEEEVAEEDGIANVLATRPTTNQRREMILDVVRSSTFSRKRARRLFGGMTMALSRIVGDGYCLPPHPRVRAINDEDDDDGMDGEDDNMAEEAEAEAEEAVRFLGCCASLVEAYLRGMLIRQGDKRQKQQQPRASLSSSSSSSSTRQTKPIEVVDEAFEVGGTLHDLLFPLQQGRHRSSSSRWSRYASRAQSSIFSMCELWWHGNFIDRERMVTQLVPLLLVRCLDANARRDDVRRLCSVRTAIDLLDFDDSSTSSLKVHLLRTVGNPLFLRCNEGRKFVGHMLLVDASFVAEVHDAVKAQIPGAKKSVLEAYAEIYYGAWKASTEMISDDDDDHDDRRHDREGMEDEVGEGGERRRIVAAAMGDIQSSIEENALQDLMYHSMHASSSATAKSARAVLDRFHVNKKAHDVESMLHRTYGPLLWRGLTSANARVRVRSCAVLADTFPLRDPRAGEGSTEAVVERSTGALVMSMKDEVPCVRVAGSVATARILGCFWAMIPISDIRTLLDREYDTTRVRRVRVTSFFLWSLPW
jgi:condensin-2 complex subunit G2